MSLLHAVHAFAAVVAGLLGAWQLFVSRKGSSQHRFSGRIWVGLMLFVATSSFLIREPGDGGRIAGFSWLHLLSILTIVMVSLGLRAARQGNIRMHRANMVGSWIGLMIAGYFASFGADRDVQALGAERPTALIVLLLGACAATAAVLMLGRALLRERAAS